jgi:ribosomal protein S18 acetylase RimI-like enzyme
MRRLDTITGHADRIRIGTWRGDPGIALLSPMPGTSPSAPALARAIVHAAGRGFHTVLTPALTESEQGIFRERGFTVHENLHLLRHQLSSVPPDTAPHLRMRRGRSRDITAVLDVDGLAFDRFWRFDVGGLTDARRATPRSRFRVAVIDDGVIGYHVTGAAGSLGYLQRLAVHPAESGHGFGSALIGDSLGWCRRRGCTSVLVNTQETNSRALTLYRRLGFADEPTGLAVLEYSLVDGPVR